MPTCAHHARTRTDIQNSRLWLVADIVDCGSYQIQPTCAHHARIRTARARVYPKKRGKLRTARARARRGARTQTARPWGKRQSLLRVPSIIASGSKFHQKTALTLHADGAPIARARAQVALTLVHARTVPVVPRRGLVIPRLPDVDALPRRRRDIRPVRPGAREARREAACVQVSGRDTGPAYGCRGEALAPGLGAEEICDL